MDQLLHEIAKHYWEPWFQLTGIILLIFGFIVGSICRIIIPDKTLGAEGLKELLKARQTEKKLLFRIGQLDFEVSEVKRENMKLKDKLNENSN